MKRFEKKDHDAGKEYEKSSSKSHYEIFHRYCGKDVEKFMEGMHNFIKLQAFITTAYF